MLQLAAFAGSLLIHDALHARGVRFGVLLGQSLGEISALTAAGAFTAREGTEIICHRIPALREHDGSGGGLVALGYGRAYAEQILALLPDPVVRIAVNNGPRQVGACTHPASRLLRGLPGPHLGKHAPAPSRRWGAVTLGSALARVRRNSWIRAITSGFIRALSPADQRVAA